MWKVIGGIVVVIAVLAAIGSNVEERAGIQTASIEESQGCEATLAEFNKLRTGTGINQAERIIGCEGVEISRNELPGIVPANSTIVTVMYQWDGNAPLAGMNAIFQNGDLMQKSQMGLR